MRRRFFVAAVILAGFALVGCDSATHVNVDNARLKELIAQGVPIYDIRRPEEWRQTGIVPGSRMLTWVDGSGRPNPDFLPSFSAAVDKSAPVVLICRTGSRTDRLARELMQEYGYSKIYNVEDGIVRWIAEGNSVIK